VSEQILNGTSAELGYTLPFTLVHAGKYRTEDKSKADTTNTKDNPEKANNTKYSKTKLARFSHFLQHSASRSKQLVRQRTKMHLVVVTVINLTKFCKNATKAEFQQSSESTTI